MRILILTAVLLTLAASTHADDYVLDGQWQLNLPESDKVAIKYEEGSGTGRRNILQNGTISVNGLPLPTIRIRQGPASGLPAKNPEVLLCNLMQIDADGDRMTLTYDNDEKEKMRRGDYRGRTTKWDKKGLKQSYRTPERKVTKTWSMRDDGRLLVEVKINPRGDRARTYRRVFDRVEASVDGLDDGPVDNPTVEREPNAT